MKWMYLQVNLLHLLNILSIYVFFVNSHSYAYLPTDETTSVPQFSASLRHNQNTADI